MIGDRKFAGYQVVSSLKVEIHQMLNYNIPPDFHSVFKDRFIVIAEIEFADGSRSQLQGPPLELEDAREECAKVLERCRADILRSEALSKPTEIKL